MYVFDCLCSTQAMKLTMSLQPEKSKVSVKSEEIAIQQFYNQLSTVEAQKWVAELQPQSLGTFKAKARYSPYTDEAWKGKLAYLLCEDDQTFPVQLQQLFVQSGFFDIVESLPGSHSTFLDMPEKTADVIIKFIVAFGKEGGSS